MNNIIVTPAIGMPANDIVLFLASLRRFYQGEVLFFVGKDDHLLKKNIKYYDSSFLEVNSHKHEIIIKRYRILIDFLKKKNNIDNIFFCDSRDIYFQSDPFNYLYKSPLNFFSEEANIEDCAINSKWMNKTLGKKTFEDLKKKQIVCCGTVMGRVDAFQKYALEMDKMAKKYPFKKRLKYLLTLRRDKEGRGCDQSYAAYLIYKKILNNIKIYSNSSGPVATVYHLNNYNFNKDNELINSKNEPYVVVHQYDKKWNEFKNSVNKLKKELNIC
tara:strand:- start:1251 stop:2066 length:816 start_codon:yes stop_codon:yes gene_type:complete